MKNSRFFYEPKYSNSRALIIGIDKYKSSSPLVYAGSDAKVIAEILEDEFAFPKKNITCLIDEAATKTKIMNAYMSFTTEDIDENEKIIVFFAGHGLTKSGNRGDVGFLVPYDANTSDISSLIRWDDLTGYAELISAKHLLFIMDACYGGLAITRNQEPGSARFVKDMLQRHARQVLTAGKHDEVVSDAGGPIPEHSVFTGHLIQALNGNAATSQGIITANSIMAYVYEKVSSDKDSRQTPHYGYLDGDGDFIFKHPSWDNLSKDNTKDVDELVIVPSSNEVSSSESRNKIEVIKRFLADETAYIELHDIVVKEIQRFLSLSSDDHFKVQGIQFSQDEFLERISKYESLISDIASISACISYWGTPSHSQILQKVMSRTTDRLESHNGLVIWLSLRWYPIIILLYSAGIAAIAGQRYDSLANILNAKTLNSDSRNDQGVLINSINKAFLEFNRNDLFKNVPGHEKYYVPLSEYLYKLIQPPLDDILFIGKDYESLFDEFEVMLALAIADQRARNGDNVWGPPGRFGWKQWDSDNSPLGRIINTAKKEGEEWAPLNQGLFGKDYDRFIRVAEEYQQNISGLPWI